MTSNESELVRIAPKLQDRCYATLSSPQNFAIIGIGKTIGTVACKIPWRRMRQLQLQLDAPPSPEPTLAQMSLPSRVPADQFASVKRVSLVYEGSLQDRPIISTTDDAKRLFKNYWQRHPANDQEQFVVACLDTKHRVQCVVKVTVGTLDASLVHPREVFKPAFIEGSAAILLSHNHPSGNPEPSREDVLVTERLTDAGKLLGIAVLDHIIHGDGTGEVRSIREH